MQRYRKIPAEIEAAQITRENINTLAEWCKGKVVQWHTEPRLEIQTMHQGYQWAEVGDWLAKGEEEGDFYPIKDRIFTKTYEPVE